MRKHVLGSTPMVWLNNHPIKILLMDLISHLSRSQEYRCGYTSRESTSLDKRKEDRMNKGGIFDF
jgi:hypothetical protein